MKRSSIPNLTLNPNPNLRLIALLFVATSSLALERLEPAEGCYFGVNIGEGDTMSSLSTRLGIVPAVYVQFFHFPLTAELRNQLNGFWPK